MITETINYNLQTQLLDLRRFVGNTPLFPLHNLISNPEVKLFAKLEWQQIGESVKARAAFEIIAQAIRSGQLGAGQELVDASSGNTAIAYATIAANLGLKTKIFIPANASTERKRILTALGADLVFTSPLDGTDGAQYEAKSFAEQYPGSVYYANQYANDHNWKAHKFHTSNEIWNQTRAQVTHFVTGLGTTGTFTGTTRGLKSLNENIRAIELQPDAPMHGLEGWKHLDTAVVPKFYKSSLADERRIVGTDKALDLIKVVAKNYGLLLSPSAAANLQGAIDVANELTSGTVVTVFPDNADKYGEVIQEIYS